MNATTKAQRKPKLNKMRPNAWLVFFALTCLVTVNSCEGNSSRIRAVVDRYHHGLKTKNNEELLGTLADEIRVKRSFEDVVLTPEQFLERVQTNYEFLHDIDIVGWTSETSNGRGSITCFEKESFSKPNSETIVHEAVYVYGVKQVNGEWKIDTIEQR
jgi:hypothetical protein